MSEASAQSGRLSTNERWVSVALAALMAAQALLGLLASEAYRDVAWIKATWFGNDLVTLLIAVPLLLGSMWFLSRGSTRARLIWLGVLGYAFYNYAYYVLGAALNVFFAIYVLTFVVAAASLITGLVRTDATSIASAFSVNTPARTLGGYYVFVATGLSVVWLATWAAYVFAGRPTPVETEAFHLVAALDMTLMVPVLVTGGVLLWRRRPWGYVIATVAGIQASLYLLVLSVNSTVAIRRGLAAAPGELPIWGTLLVFTLAATAWLLHSCDAPNKRIQA
ncbi:MAG TPA: hypothetical protein VNI77_08380, partial [Nitrososphaera sp.]|nr:hypothetical protein [Nitrososphaera sp.]